MRAGTLIFLTLWAILGLATSCTPCSANPVSQKDTASAPCSTHADCGKEGFCDSAKDYVCSKCCLSNADCKNPDAQDGEFCRGDGRCSPKIFETVWTVTAKDSELILPFDEKHGGCDFRILWGDEGHTDFSKAARVTDCSNAKNRTYRYANPGSYHVRITGTYDGWGQDTKEIASKANVRLPPPNSSMGPIWLGPDCKPIGSETVRLQGVVSFGPVGLTREAFCRVGNIYLPQNDIPDASKWHDATATFMLAQSFNQDIGRWDTSGLKSMDSMFLQASDFNQDIGQWNTSNVTTMNQMFYKASDFNQDIGQWNTANVTTMNQIFYKANTFNQDIGQWNTANVTDMSRMFSQANAFNQNIGQWNTANVTNMSGMFFDACTFNQDIRQWNTSNVTNMSYMFAANAIQNHRHEGNAILNRQHEEKVCQARSSFNQDIGRWDTSKVTDMGSMFYGAIAFNQNIGRWDTANATGMRGMFSEASSFNQNIGRWNTSNVKDMAYMFNGAKAFNQDISQWNTANVITTMWMFGNTPSWGADNTSSISRDNTSSISRDNFCKFRARLAQKHWVDLGLNHTCP